MNVRDFYSLSFYERTEIAETLIRENKLVTTIPYFLSKTHKVFLVVYENNELMCSACIKSNDEIGYFFKREGFSQFGLFLLYFVQKSLELNKLIYFGLVRADNIKSNKLMNSCGFLVESKYVNLNGNEIIRYLFDLEKLNIYAIKRNLTEVEKF